MSRLPIGSSSSACREAVALALLSLVLGSWVNGLGA